MTIVLPVPPSVRHVFLTSFREVGAKFGGSVEARDNGGGDHLSGFDVCGKVHAADEAALFVLFGAIHEGLGAVGGDAGEDHGDRPAVDAVA